MPRKKKAPQPAAPAPQSDATKAIPAGALGPPPAPGPRTKYILYGTASKDGRSHAIHEDRLQSEAEGQVWLTMHAMRGWKVSGVLVQLDNGQDKNGERHIIRRVGDGRAWRE